MIKLITSKNIRITSKIAVILSIACMIIAIANLFVGNDTMRTIVWTGCFIAIALDILSMLSTEQKLLKENFSLRYEKMLLIQSYLAMG